MTKTIFQVKNMDCASCAALIESDLEEAGFQASCSYAQEKLEIEHENELPTEKIIEIVKQTGYELVQ